MNKLISRLALVAIIGFSLCFESCKDEPELLPKENQELVVTPFGSVDRAAVYEIEDGYVTKIENNHLVKIEKGTSKIVLDLGEMKLVKPGTANGRTFGVDPSFVNGDIVSVHNSAPVNASLPYNNFRVTMTVPAKPTQNNQTIFIGSRMLTFDNFGTEFAAVLQYGPSAAGGGWYWTACAWKTSANGVVTHSPLVTVSPGASVTSQIIWQVNSYDANIANSNLNFLSPLVNSDIFLLLAGSPKTTGSYPPQFSMSMTGITIQSTAQGTFPPVTWSTFTSGSLGENFKSISTANSSGQVDLRFYGTPSNLFYPNNSVYPLRLTWNSTPRATGYEVSYYVIDHTGHQTNYSGTSTTNSFTFPFTSTSCKGCELVSKVRANYSGGLVSDWSYAFNTTMY